MNENKRLTEKGLGELAAKIRTARKEAGLSQSSLANHIGVSDKAVSSYETSRSMPTVDKLKEISQTTKKPLSFFLEEEVDNYGLLKTLEKIEVEIRAIRELLTLKQTK